MRILFLVLGYALAKYYHIVAHNNRSLTLTITEDNVGFAPFDPYSPQQKVEITDDKIHKNKKILCSSPVTSQVRLCGSGTPINSHFEKVFLNNTVKFATKGNSVLSIGPYNDSTDMYDVVVLPEELVASTAYTFQIKEVDSDFNILNKSKIKSKK